MANNNNGNIVFDFDGEDLLSEGINNVLNIGADDNDPDNGDDSDGSRGSGNNSPDDEIDNIIRNSLTDQYDDDDDEEESEDNQDKGNPKDKNNGKSDKSEEATTFSTRDLLDIIKQENLLYIPDDFDDELDADSIDYLKNLTREIQEEEIIESIRSRYDSDPYKLALFDYFVAGGPDADIPAFKQTVDNVQYYESLNIDDENNRRKILEQFLAEGLDPKIPSHKFRLDKISEEVDSLFDSYADKDKAREAKDYFVNKHKNIANIQMQQAAQQQEMQRRAEEQEMQRQQMWHDNFRQTLNQREWSNSKKQEILREQYEEIQLADGSYAPKWWVKEAMIKQDPKLYQVYLDWLNTNFDLEKGTFKSSSSNKKDDNDKVTRKILDLIGKKKSRVSSDTYDNDESNYFPKGRVDAMKNI